MTADDISRPSSPLTALRQHAVLAVVLAVAGAALGVAGAAARPVITTAQARLGVGTGDLAAYEIPGFALASQQLAASYARYVNEGTRSVDLAPLGELRNQITEVRASPIADSSIIIIEVSATSETAALRGAATVATELTDKVGQQAASGSLTTLLAAYTKASRDAAQASTLVTVRSGALQRSLSNGASAAVLKKARKDLVDAQTEASVATVQQTALANRYQTLVTSANGGGALRSVAPAFVAGTDLRSKQERFGALGLVLGLGLALVVAVLLDRRRVQRALARHVKATSPVVSPPTTHAVAVVPPLDDPVEPAPSPVVEAVPPPVEPVAEPTPEPIPEPVAAVPPAFGPWAARPPEPPRYFQDEPDLRPTNPP